MMEEMSTASGRASGTVLTVTYPVSSSTVNRSRPLPTRSSIYFQKNCITSTKSRMKKVATKGPVNALRMSLSSFFTTRFNTFMPCNRQN